MAEEDDVGPVLAPLFEEQFHPILGAIVMAVRHEDAPVGNPQEALEREQCTEVTVASHGVEAHGRIRCAEGSDVGLAIPAVEHAGDLGMPAHRLLQVGRVTMRIGDDQNVHARNKGWIPACAEKHPSYGNKVLGGMTEGKWE
jgi:uncharacterized protein involved in high-affinity Fe2+ transport